MSETLRTAPSTSTFFPDLIQGGMGFDISNWRLAKAVALAGKELGRDCLGVVASIGGAPVLLTEDLQIGDPDTIRILKTFCPHKPEIAQGILDEFKPGGHKLPPKPEVLVNGTDRIKEKMTNIAVAAAYVAIKKAKEGHDRPIGINLLEKNQLLILPTLLGAMIAGVDYVLVGAGLPNQIPMALKDLAESQVASYGLTVTGSKSSYPLMLNPQPYTNRQPLNVPMFFPIVGSHVLAEYLSKKTKIDGVVAENPKAGGHSAPPKKKEVKDGIAIYSEEDEIDLNRMRKLGKPFYLAGGMAKKLKEAKEEGATGVQCGTIFALSNESGMDPEIAQRLRNRIKRRKQTVVNSALTSPALYPFHVAVDDESLSNPEQAARVKKVCAFGILVQAYVRTFKDDGTMKEIGFRCPAGPGFVEKGGKPEEEAGRVCLCAGLLRTTGRGKKDQPPIMTLGEDLSSVEELVDANPDGKYSILDAVRHVYSYEARQGNQSQ